jgi:diguanylate cyclase (GGDEF)-like protein
VASILVRGHLSLGAFPRAETVGRVLAITLIMACGSYLARSYHTMRRAVIERGAAEAEARAAALTDELTGVFNRRGFRALAEHQLRVARRAGTDVMVLYVDLDRFKQVNDRCGHAAGDRALREVADLLRLTMRETDVVARLGGDEFGVLIVDADPATESAVRGRIARAVAARNALPNREYQVAFTVGAASLDGDRAAGLDDLMATADRSLYAAKRRRAANIT